MTTTTQETRWSTPREVYGECDCPHVEHHLHAGRCASRRVIAYVRTKLARCRARCDRGRKHSRCETPAACTCQPGSCLRCGSSPEPGWVKAECEACGGTGRKGTKPGTLGAAVFLARGGPPSDSMPRPLHGPGSHNRVCLDCHGTGHPTERMERKLWLEIVVALLEAAKHNREVGRPEMDLSPAKVQDAQIDFALAIADMLEGQG